MWSRQSTSAPRSIPELQVFRKERLIVEEDSCRFRVKVKAEEIMSLLFFIFLYRITFSSSMFVNWRANNNVELVF